MVCEMLGYKNVETTQRYLGVDYTKLRNALEAMSVTESNVMDKTLDILSGLKEHFRTNPPEETPSVAHEKSGDSEEHDENHAG